MGLVADAVVIGAGVIGSSIALELSRSGLSVIVVDRASGPGQGSTSASSAVVRFNYSTASGLAAAWESAHCWWAWADHLGSADDVGQHTGLTIDLAALSRLRARNADSSGTVMG